ncbi:MAG: hypothetical protein V3V08_01110 [Nannocystaceae bacterium]
MKRPVGLVLAISASLWGLPATRASAAKDVDEAPLTTRTRVDTTEVDTDNMISAQIEAAIAARAGEHGIARVDDAHAATELAIHVNWIDHEIAHYGFEIMASRANGENATFRGSCETCTDQELVDRVLDALPEAAAFLLHTNDEAPDNGAAALANDQEDANEGLLSSTRADKGGADAPHPPPAADRKHNLNTLMIGGLATSAAGAMMLGVTAAAAMAQADASSWRNLTGDPDRKRQLRQRELNMFKLKVGGALATGALIAAGTTMFLLGRQKQTDRALALTPTWSRGHAGLAVTGRF